MNAHDQQKPSEKPNERPSARDDRKSDEANGTGAKTPSTDMQPEDAGTPESGNTGAGAAAENAMKQTSKTPFERR